MKKFIFVLVLLLIPYQIFAISSPFVAPALNTETAAYSKLTTVTNANQKTLDKNISLVKHSTGITLASITCNTSLATWYGLSNPSVDLRPYALIPGVQMVQSDGTKTSTFSGTFTLGTGETYGSTLLSNGNMETGDPPTGWIGNNSTLSSVADERTGGSGTKSIKVERTGTDSCAYQTIALNGALIKYDYWRKGDGTNNGRLILSNALSGTVSLFEDSSYTTATWENRTGLKTLNSATIYVRLATSSTIAAYSQFDDANLYQVLTPSLYGFSASSKSTEVGFDPKAASYTLTITRP